MTETAQAAGPSSTATMDAVTQFEQAFGTLPDLLRAHGRDQPTHLAVIDGERTLDYAGLDALADRVAAALQRDGVEVGEAVAVCALTSLEYVALFMGTLRAGATAAPLAPSSTAEALAGMIADCGARLFFLDADTHARLGEQPLPERVARVALDGSGVGRAFAEWLAPEGARPAAVAIGPKLPFNMIYSSGTTGVPKGIVQSHAMRWSQLSGARGYGPDAVTVISTPLYSNTTLVSILPTLAWGGTCVLMAKFDATRFLELAQANRATHAMLVPVQYRRLMDHPGFDSYDLSSFKMKFATSAPFAADLKADVLRRWPGGLVEYFGMTEGGGTCILFAHEHPDKLHTVGRPAPGHDIRLVGEDGVEVPAGEVGEIVGKSVAMMNGYHNRPDKTAEALWVSPEGDTFMRTGDVGRFDAEGFLTLMDRKKDMVISGGFNIYPSDLEAVLLQHPDVAEAAVVGVASRAWGETPVGFATLKAGSQATGEQLREWANERLGKTQRLSDLQLLDALPRSHIGKVLKRELRDGYAGAVA